ncbi:hypothetical protein [Caulobacter sp. NIBR1757]|uniref:hypothetical protein n=1 Tax=Caulobacter sp. NIBR1757 TaxID=3016000 RepID=UPI0022F006A5|nr:hypothetical protein [Caulobacter sp. NIBR1757]WGM38959.1 hypothetical protein AMEJIAPC_01869 [Caulobacter sp. NIBR1757]
MRNTTRSILLACAVTLAGASLSACVTPVPFKVPLATGARDAITSTEVVAPVKQSEIYVYVAPVSTGGQGGLIGALVAAGIDAASTEAAQKAVQPARDSIVDYDFDARLKADLQTQLSGVSFLKVDGVRVSKDAFQPGLDKAIADSKASAVLITVADYQFSTDAASVTVTLAADLYANSAALTPFKPTATANAKVPSYGGNAIYRNTFTYSQLLPAPTTVRDTNIRMWAADNGKAIREALDAGSAAVAGKLATDIQRAPPPVAAK